MTFLAVFDELLPTVLVVWLGGTWTLRHIENGVFVITQIATARRRRKAQAWADFKAATDQAWADYQAVTS